MKPYQCIGYILLSGTLLTYATSCQPQDSLFEKQPGALEQILTPEEENKNLSEALLVPIVDAMIDHWLKTASTKHNKHNPTDFQDRIIYEPANSNYLRFYE